MKDSNQLRGEYRLARAKEIFPGEDVHIRRVKLEYKNLQQTGDIQNAVGDLMRSSFITVERSIHNIAVIVPADWSQKETEAAVTSGLQFNCAF